MNSRRSGGLLLMCACPLAMPELPVFERDALHRFRGFVEPPAFAAGQVTFYGGNRLWAAEMNVRSLPAHVVDELLFIAFFGERLNFNMATIRRQAANDPVFGKMDVGIEDTHGAFHQFPTENRIGPELLCPNPG